MEKRILLFGNDEGLPGVKVDMKNYKQFFKSPVGGNWLDIEINTLINPTKKELVDWLSLYKNLSLDYLIVIYSGHGGQERETLLEINPKGELIGESELKHIAKRQLNVFDCCRCYPESLHESFQLEALAKSFSAFNTRQIFEKRILQAIPQQVSLYSCAIGEISNDTKEGGIYSQTFLMSARQIHDEYKLIGTTHIEAAEKTIEITKHLPKEKHQHPEAILPKCLSSQQLIISINPSNSTL
jgi:hypothetical protein